MSNEIKVLKGGKLIDGTGKEPLNNSLVLIKDNKIEKVGTVDSIKYPSSAKVYNAKGKTILPGLIDAHMHFSGINTLNNLEYVLDHPYLRISRAVIDAWRLIDSGFTTCREMQNITAIYLREAVNEGSIVGPRIVSCGSAITMTGGHLDEAHSIPINWISEYGFCRIADGPTECRKAVREQIRVGADFIKICTSGGVMSDRGMPTDSQYSIKEINAICDEAKSSNKIVSAHAHGKDGIRKALRGGVKSIEHGTYIDDEIIDLLLKNDAWYIPTFSITEALLLYGKQAGLREESLCKLKSIGRIHKDGFQKAMKAGVKIGLGSDFLLSPMISNGLMKSHARELEIYVELGMSPMDTIVCATKNNSKLLKMNDRIGTIEKNKLADLIVISGDPLKDINVLQNKEKLEYIFKDGENVPRFCM